MLAFVAQKNTQSKTLLGNLGSVLIKNKNIFQQNKRKVHAQNSNKS